MLENRAILQFTIEVTARCNNNCRHCYVNVPASDSSAKKAEPTLKEIGDVADQAIEMGAIWCTITGGEPLLREDFSNIYLSLKKRGLLVSIYTNAAMVDEGHIELFKRYPPREIEVTVYGITRETYEAVTRRPGSYQAFVRGLKMLQDVGLKVRLKAMALRSNLHEFSQIARFCREGTADYFRFDPFLHLRFDGNRGRNEEIRSERLTPEEIAILEREDPVRFHSLKKSCTKQNNSGACNIKCDHLFHCGAGVGSFVLGSDCNLRLCSSLKHPDCIYDLRKGNLADAWQKVVPKVRDMRSSRQEFLMNCRTCPLTQLCIWCPANSYLEEGIMDAHVSYFCEVAHARAKSLEEVKDNIAEKTSRNSRSSG